MHDEPFIRLKYITAQKYTVAEEGTFSGSVSPHHKVQGETCKKSIAKINCNYYVTLSDSRNMPESKMSTLLYPMYNI